MLKIEIFKNCIYQQYSCIKLFILGTILTLIFTNRIIILMSVRLYYESGKFNAYRYNYLLTNIKLFRRLSKYFSKYFIVSFLFVEGKLSQFQTSKINLNIRNILYRVKSKIIL